MDRQTETNHWFSFSRRIHHPKEISCSRLRGTWWLKVDFIGIWAITTSYPHYPGDQELTGFGHATYFGERGLLRSEILPNHWIVLVWLGVKRVGGGKGGRGYPETEGILWAVSGESSCGGQVETSSLPADAPIQGYDLVPLHETISKLDCTTKQWAKYTACGLACYEYLSWRDGHHTHDTGVLTEARDARAGGGGGRHPHWKRPHTPVIC